MTKRCLCLATPVLLLALTPAPAQELEPKYRRAADRGLTWLVSQQHRDGHWEGNGGVYAAPMTALAGMALLAEGSTPREGRYAVNLRRATDWLLARSEPRGLLANPNHPADVARYMYGHGLGLWFLSQIYSEEEDTDRRKKLIDVLTRAVKFSAEAQTSRGGWGYVSARDGNDFDEGAVTYVQLHALLAARNAGIPVPREPIRRCFDYLRKAQNDDGGLAYSLAGGNAMSRPTISAEALPLVLASDMVEMDTKRKLLAFVRANVPPDRPIGARSLETLYAHFYLSQAVHQLGEEGYGKLLPDSKPEERLVWSRYRAALFEQVLAGQKEDGSWSGGNVGPVFETACCLVILQRDLQPPPYPGR
jgi:hypothetical protein